MDQQNQIEKQIYTDLYLDENNRIKKKLNKKGYGHENHAKKRGVYKIIEALNIKSICDVGCGAGGFCNGISNSCPVVYGIDFASVDTNKTIKNDKVKYISAEAHNIPLPDNSVELITSFDCLEHCLPQDIDKVFQEFNRIATKGYVLTMPYGSQHDTQLLHKIIQKQGWWMDKIKEHCPSIKIYKIRFKKRGFLLCIFENKLKK